MGSQFLGLGLESQEPFRPLPFFPQQQVHFFLLFLFLIRPLLDPGLCPSFFHFDFLEFLQTPLPGLFLYFSRLGQCLPLLPNSSAGCFQVPGFFCQLLDLLFPGTETFPRLFLAAAEGTSCIDHIPFQGHHPYPHIGFPSSCQGVVQGIGHQHLSQEELDCRTETCFALDQIPSDPDDPWAAQGRSFPAAQQPGPQGIQG